MADRKPITILDVAKAWGVKEDEHGIPAEEFDRLGLPMLGGCQSCGASIACYNAAPTKTGYLSCANDEGCIDEEIAFFSVEEFEVNHPRPKEASNAPSQEADQA